MTQNEINIANSLASNWKIISNDGTNLGATNNITGSSFNGTTVAFNAMIKVVYAIDASSVLAVTADRQLTASDNGLTLINSGPTSSYTLTVMGGINKEIMLQADTSGSGSLTITAGSGVTFIGSTTRTCAAGKLLIILPTLTANVYKIVAN